MTTQTYRIEIRFDLTGTEDEVRAKADTIAGIVAGLDDVNSEAEVTAIFDENWEEI